MKFRNLLTLTFMAAASAVAAQSVLPFNRVETKEVMKRVADWQIENPGTHDALDWTNGALYVGMADWAAISDETDHNDKYWEWMKKKLGARQFQMGDRMYNADDLTVGQANIDLYKKYGNKRILWPTTARIDWVIEHLEENSLDFRVQTEYIKDRWSWCDALFMAPPVFAKLYRLTGEKRYIKFLNREYKASYDYLFDKEENLFYRDSRYFDMKEANGKKVFWGRGNGWVIAGLVEILKAIPENDKNRRFYEEVLVKLSNSLVDLQCADGYWHASLLDPDSYPAPETSATGFIVYGLAYGVHTGLLDADRFVPVITKGWKAMLAAVESNGKLGHVQPIGSDPKKVTREMTEVYGVGAFLAAGSEIYYMVK